MSFESFIILAVFVSGWILTCLVAVSSALNEAVFFYIPLLTEVKIQEQKLKSKIKFISDIATR